MFSAALENENLLFSLAGQLEKAQPWKEPLQRNEIEIFKTI